MNKHDPDFDEIIAVERSWVKAHRELDLERISEILSD